MLYHVISCYIITYIYIYIITSMFSMASGLRQVFSRISPGLHTPSLFFWAQGHLLAEFKDKASDAGDRPQDMTSWLISWVASVASVDELMSWIHYDPQWSTMIHGWKIKRTRREANAVGCCRNLRHRALQHEFLQVKSCRKPPPWIPSYRTFGTRPFLDISGSLEYGCDMWLRITSDHESLRNRLGIAWYFHWYFLKVHWYFRGSCRPWRLSGPGTARRRRLGDRSGDGDPPWRRRSVNTKTGCENCVKMTWVTCTVNMCKHV